MKDQRTSYTYGAEDKCLWKYVAYVWLDSDHLHCDKKLGPYAYYWWVLQQAVRPADENLWYSYKFFKKINNNL